MGMPARSSKTEPSWMLPSIHQSWPTGILTYCHFSLWIPAAGWFPRARISCPYGTGQNVKLHNRKVCFFAFSLSHHVSLWDAVLGAYRLIRGSVLG